GGGLNNGGGRVRLVVGCDRYGLRHSDGLSRRWLGVVEHRNHQEKQKQNRNAAGNSDQHPLLLGRLLNLDFRRSRIGTKRLEKNLVGFVHRRSLRGGLRFARRRS